MESSSESESSVSPKNNSGSCLAIPIFNKALSTKFSQRRRHNLRGSNGLDPNYVNPKAQGHSNRSKGNSQIFKIKSTQSIPRFSLNSLKRSDSIKKYHLAVDKRSKFRKSAGKQKSLLSPNRCRTDQNSCSNKKTSNKKRQRQADEVFYSGKDSLQLHLEFDESEDTSGWKKISDFILHKGQRHFKKSVKKLNQIKINQAKAFIMDKMIRPKATVQSVKSISTIQSVSSRKSLESFLSSRKFKKLKISRYRMTSKNIKNQANSFCIPKLVITTESNSKIELEQKSPLGLSHFSKAKVKPAKLLFRRLQSDQEKPKKIKRKLTRPKSGQPTLYKSRKAMLKAPRLDHFQIKFKKVLVPQKSHKVFKNRKNYLP
ncbi:unnamed protein product [Moneuplotes crassus]|uniref:Uncharacterized protein n=1 Tax=Euplotes crassus TaxID=5936 RepID=A0AAD1UNQ9_EUPCR|nr:unnamed protein product [Moneuplotes crassus]